MVSILIKKYLSIIFFVGIIGMLLSMLYPIDKKSKIKYVTKIVMPSDSKYFLEGLAPVNFVDKIYKIELSKNKFEECNLDNLHGPVRSNDKATVWIEGDSIDPKGVMLNVVMQSEVNSRKCAAKILELVTLNYKLNSVAAKKSFDHQIKNLKMDINLRKEVRQTLIPAPGNFFMGEIEQMYKTLWNLERESQSIDFNSSPALFEAGIQVVPAVLSAKFKLICGFFVGTLIAMIAILLCFDTAKYKLQKQKVK